MSLGCPRKRKRLQPSRYWPMRPGIAGRRTFPRQPGPSGQPYWARSVTLEAVLTTETQRHRDKSRISSGTRAVPTGRGSSLFSYPALNHPNPRKVAAGWGPRSPWANLCRAYGAQFFHFPLCLCVSVVIFLAGCAQKPKPNTLVMIIESSPINLDPRVGVDAQSQRIDELLFDPLVTRDSHFNLQPDLAERWEIVDPLTYVFHLRQGVRFHNGQPLTARDVKWTFDSLISGKVRSAKAGTFASVSGIETPDDNT